MKSKQKKIVVIVLILAGMFSSCADKPVEPVPKDFCSCVNSEDIEQTIPFINEALSDLDDVVELAAWFKSQPCIADALYFVNTVTNTCMFLISFVEDGVTKKLILDVPTTIPLKTTGYREYDTDFCFCFETENFGKMITIINEWLSELPDDLTDSQIKTVMAAWFNEQPCRPWWMFGHGTSLGDVFFLKDDIYYKLKISTSHPMKVYDFRKIINCELDKVLNGEINILKSFKDEPGFIGRSIPYYAGGFSYFYFEPVTRYNDISKRLYVGNYFDGDDVFRQYINVPKELVLLTGYVVNCSEVNRDREYNDDGVLVGGVKSVIY